MGRPSLFTPDVADEICARVMCGEGIAAICRDSRMPGERTVYSWLENNQEFQQRYARAREIQAEHYADEVIEISDTEEDPHRARVRCDSRKWAASKLAPKKYGDRLEHVGAGGKDLIPERASDSDRIMGAFFAAIKTLPGPKE